MASNKRLSQEVLEQLHAMYSSGQYSNVRLAEQFGVSESVIRKKAKELGWQRDNAALIRAEGRALLQREDAVAAAPGARVTEADVVRVGAQQLAAVERDHRDRASRLKGLADRLYSDLRDVSDNTEMIGEVLERALANEQISDALITSLAAKLEAGSRIKAFKALVEATDKLVGIERKAYNMDREGGGGSIDDFLTSLTAAAGVYVPPAAPALPAASMEEER